MTTRAAAILAAVLVAFATGLWGCSSPSTEATQVTASGRSGGTQTQAPAPRREQALLEDLALGNRILARQLDILDIQGHLTARSLDNPNHYYIARFVSPGGATVEHFIENTLESEPVDGPRNDQAREIYLHGEIYKARPDVMAIVHAHTEEFVAYAMSSVALYNGDRAVPVWDIRPFNRGRSGIVNTPALGKATAEALGDHEGVLLWGHGIALTGSSIAEAVLRADALRDSAQLQQAAIAMGGAWKPRANGGEEGNAVDTRAWEFYKAAELKTTGGRVPQTLAPAREKPADPNEAAKLDLVLANRILAEQLDILDTSGHVSVRSPNNANAYFVAPRVAPAAVTAGDVVERDITAPSADSQGLAIHDEIYKARPDVKAILYARTPEVVAFTTGSVALRPIVNAGAFVGDGLPTFAFTSPADPAAGRGVAAALGKSSAVLLPGHGFVLTAASIYNLADRAYQLRQNAIIERQAIALRGKVAYLNDGRVEPAPANAPGAAAPLGPAEGRAWIYWSENVSIER
jgi:ribulose-5-phosphate 4-epimerase/fuculose-1-phosphate aldolase